MVMFSFKNTCYYFLFLCILLCSYQCESDSSVPSSTQQSFQLLSPEESGIYFSNPILETEEFNSFLWNSGYSGAGVAVGDINNDGLTDIYIVGNDRPDALYLNKGNMKFEDITEKAGLEHDERWVFGATMADINQDGWLDIYTCVSGYSLKADDRRNRLYINNGDATFTEKAEAYGLRDGGFSIQATFFDMDKDGDLDMYLANQPPDGRLISRLNIPLSMIETAKTDKLYINNGDETFTNISDQAGTTNPAYSLNAIATDINNDGWTDIYVSNDYQLPDYCYINNGDNTFTEQAKEYFKHISYFTMGADIGDINNDGLLDIFSVDMAPEDHVRSKTNMETMSTEAFWRNVASGNHFQFMFNTLQLNRGNNSFAEIGQFSGMAKTDWSWAALLADLDNDGYRDAFVTNGILRDLRNNDVMNFIAEMNKKGQSEFLMMEMLEKLPSNPLPNYMFKNNGNYTFSNKAEEWDMAQPGFSSGASYADLDNDGDLDLVVNNTNSPFAIYENHSNPNNHYIRFELEGANPNTVALNAQVTIEYNGQTQIQELTRTRGYLSSSEDKIHFGLGDIDMVDKVTIRWPDNTWDIFENVAADQVHTYSQNNSKYKVKPRVTTTKSLLANQSSGLKLDYSHQENDYNDFEEEVLLPHKQSENGPCISKGDVNADGLEDFYVGGAVGQAGQLFLQETDGSFKVSSSAPWQAHARSEDLGSTLFDADGDKDLDLYVVSGGNEYEQGDIFLRDRLYINDGKGNYTWSEEALPNIGISGQCVKTVDLDKDGDLDLFVGGRLIPRKYPSPADSYILQNDNGKFTDVTDEIAPGLRKLGLVTDAIFSDYDKDDDLDLIVVGEWMPISIFDNNNGELIANNNMGFEKTNGWWWSIEEGDFNKDGSPDFILGNLGKNHKFKATKEKPFKVYASDFDKNGTNDIVLACDYKDKTVPVRGRQCSSEQMPFIKEKYPTFEGFALASVEDILEEDNLKSSTSYEIRDFSSIVLMNESGRLSAKKLPSEAQFFPIKDINVTDIDDDGKQDVILIGNHYGAEVETARYDAGNGLCMLGDGKGGFKALSTLESGFHVPHDSRSIITLEGDKKRYLVASNKAPLECFGVE